jgi:hypothetical protein
MSKAWDGTGVSGWILRAGPRSWRRGRARFRLELLATRTIWWLAVPATVATGVVAVRIVRVKRSRKFDRELSATLTELNEILRHGPESQDRASIDSWIAQAELRAKAVLGRLTGIRPPNREWGDLLESYVDLAERTIAAITTGVSADQRRHLVEQGENLARRYEALRLRGG